MAVITLENEFVKADFNTVGGFIESLVSKNNNREHAWHYDSALWPRRTAVCFPLCGKCRDDKYSCGEKEYELPNHGFLRERELKADRIDSSRLVLTDEWDEGTLTRYPFKYKVEIEYVLDENNVDIKYKVKNLDKGEMYYSIGSHYTYLLPSLQEECSIFFSKKQHAGAFSQADGNLHGDVFEGKDYVSLKGTIDNSSLILDLATIDSDYVALGDEKKIVTSLKGEGFKYLIIWAPSGGKNPFVCIEFWDGMGQVETCTNELSTKWGISKLEAGGEKEYLQRVTLL